MTDDLILARGLHVLAMVHWIGGVGFATLVVLPFAMSCSSAAGAAFRRAGPHFDSDRWRGGSLVDLQDGPVGAVSRSTLLVDDGDVWLTVHAGSAMVADALSTGLYMASRAEIAPMIRAFPGVSVWAADQEGRDFRSAAQDEFGAA